MNTSSKSILFRMIAVLAILGVCWFFLKPSAADKTKIKVTEEIGQSIRSEKKIPLSNVGGIKWDYVCLAIYEAKGMDVADSLDVLRFGLGKTDFDYSSFLVANETYVELTDDTSYGLVFVSVAQKMIVAIPMHDIASVSVPEDICSLASAAFLSVKEADNNRLKLIFEGKKK